MKTFIAIFLFFALCNVVLAFDPSTRIIGGVNSTSPAHEYVVRVVSVRVEGTPVGETGYLTTGVAITCNRVLTTAQAIKDFEEWYVGSGVQVNVDDMQYHDSTEAFYHNQYDETTLHNNVGIIYTTRQIDNIISLAAAAPVIPLSIIVGGFGVSVTGDPTVVLKQGTFVSTSSAVCAEYYGTSVIRDDNFCGRSDTSQLYDGDQGGPVTNANLNVLVGTVSTFGRNIDDPAVFTNIYANNIYAWIVGHIVAC